MANAESDFLVSLQATENALLVSEGNSAESLQE
jgi:hypothetical protein